MAPAAGSGPDCQPGAGEASPEAAGVLRSTPSLSVDWCPDIRRRSGNRRAAPANL